MAVEATGTIYKAFTFDGEDSRDYGIYISGDGVFDAPVRDVEMVTIPGRNGSFALDNGRFENVTVTYPAGIFADSEADFADAISAARNWLCSKTGYCRLEDEYNTDEYRMAVYKGGLEVNLADLKAGQFEIQFECKPQRFLTSGETAVSVTSGDTLTNPTLFDASPLIQACGYGNIYINSDTLTIYNMSLGEITLGYELSTSSTDEDAFQYTISNTEFLLAGDPIYLTTRQIIDYTWYSTELDYNSFNIVNSPTESDQNNIVSNGGEITKWTYSAEINPVGVVRPYISYILKNVEFAYGTASQVDFYWSIGFTLSTGGVVGYTGDITSNISVQYNGSDTITIVIEHVYPEDYSISRDYVTTSTSTSETVKAVSSISLNGDIYFDLDIGEAYAIESGSITSAGNIVEIPASLPTLSAGDNTITFDDTVTELSVTPRWWKV